MSIKQLQEPFSTSVLSVLKETLSGYGAFKKYPIYQQVLVELDKTTVPELSFMLSVPPQTTLNGTTRVHQTRTENLLHQSTIHSANLSFAFINLTDVDGALFFRQSSKFDGEAFDQILTVTPARVIVLMAGDRPLIWLGLLEPTQPIYAARGVHLIERVGKTFIVVCGYMPGFSAYSDSWYSRQMTGTSCHVALQLVERLQKVVGDRDYM